MSDRAAPVEETVVRLNLNGAAVACWRCTPAHLDALAAGWLLSQGLVHALDELEELAVDGALVRARVRRAGPGVAEANAGEMAGSAGACDPLEALQLFPPPTVNRAAPPGSTACAELLRQLYALGGLYNEGGGMHIAGLADERGVGLAAEDVGRHNAVDKALGLGLLRGLPLERHGVVLSARISGEIALKCARAGIGWIASRSVPTTLALGVGAATGLPMIARAGGRDVRLYSPGAAGGA